MEKLWGKVASARGEDTVCPYVTSLGTFQKINLCTGSLRDKYVSLCILGRHVLLMLIRSSRASCHLDVPVNYLRQNLGGLRSGSQQSSPFTIRISLRMTNCLLRETTASLHKIYI